MADESRPPLPPFNVETAAQKVRAAENGWNLQVPEKIALAYSLDSIWRNRTEFCKDAMKSPRFCNANGRMN